MKSIIKKGLFLSLILSFTACNAQIKNSKTVNVKIYGNCEMCESKIEKAGNFPKQSQVAWDKETKIAIITYDSLNTNLDKILKRIALVGYDSDQFLAPKEVYEQLPSCCQYERALPNNIDAKKTIANHTAIVHTTTEIQTKNALENKPTKILAQTTEKQKTNQLIPLFEHYFTLKDALIETDGNKAAVQSTILLKTINTLKINDLEKETHDIWIKIVEELQKDAQSIATTYEISKQRNYFMRLSHNIYTLIKVSKYDQTIYYQHCPMFNDGKGADWLSKENIVKNPYYGNQMLSCGSTVEIIK